MKRKILSLVLAAVLTLSLAAPALAYTTPDFADLPSDNWAYGPVMRMADQGIIQGTGNGMFSPELKVSAAQFLTMVGRIVFPDTKVTESDTWYGPYVAAAQTNGLLEGTQVDTNNVEAEITRYDMAVILRAAAKKLGKAETLAQQSQVTDYLDIPTRYAESVLAVYGMGLITGDQYGNFNGANTMQRNELATVIDRLVALKNGSSQGGGNTTTEPEDPADTASYVINVLTVSEIGDTVVPGETFYVLGAPNPSSAAPYGSDRSGYTCTSSDPSVLQVTGWDGRNWTVTAMSEGTAILTVTDPCGVSGTKDFTVVAAREGIGTKTYSLFVPEARFHEHTSRGNAYTKTTFLYDIPYKIYYTRDGGKTSQLVYEGVSPAKGALSSTYTVEVELPEDAFYSKNAGFYISAETVVDGQRMVTSDLRTDGREYVTLVTHVDLNSYNLKIELTPPTGEKAKYTVPGCVFYGGPNGPRVGSGFIVRAYHKSGRLVGEAVTDDRGAFTMLCEVDALDNGFDPKTDQYYMTAIGIQDGVEMKSDGRLSNGELYLMSMNMMNGNPYRVENISTGCLIEVK